MDVMKAREELNKGKTIYDMNLRVAYYARVSTEKEEQLNSLDNQTKYFDDLIESISNWTLAGSYIDEGISGTSINNRDDFVRMIRDAQLGSFDMLMTKEVSRFARNTLDSIKYTQMLLKHEVIVHFLSDNINTIYPDSEFRLTLMASMAQDEVRKLSERVKFGMKRSVKDGRLLGGGNITGYNKKDGKLIIDEKMQPIVEMIFNLYASGEYGFRLISEKLGENGYFDTVGKLYNSNTLKRIVMNPRYKGYYSANLSYIEDYKSHKKIRLPKEKWIVYKDDNIPAIISESVWNRANEILEKRSTGHKKSLENKQSFIEKNSYTSKIICKEHNCTMIRCANGNRKNNPVWQCNEYLRHGLKACTSPVIFEKHLNAIFYGLIENFINNKQKLLETIIGDYETVIKNKNSVDNLCELKSKIVKIEDKKDKLLELNIEKMLSNEEFKIRNEKLNVELSTLRTLLLDKESLLNEADVYKEKIDNLKKSIEPELYIKRNYMYFIDLLIDKVYISKINNNRKHLRLEVIYNLDKENDVLELDIEDKKASRYKENIQKINNSDFYLSLDTNGARSICYSYPTNNSS